MPKMPNDDKMAGIRRWREEKNAANLARKKERDERGELLAARIQGITGLPMQWRGNFNVLAITPDEAEGWLSAQ